MQERVRICDIAEELGLSTATVSNVIHGKTNKVSDETVQRVTALLEKRQCPCSSRRPSAIKIPKRLPDLSTD